MLNMVYPIGRASALRTPLKPNRRVVVYNYKIYVIAPQTIIQM